MINEGSIRSNLGKSLRFKIIIQIIHNCSLCFPVGFYIVDYKSLHPMIVFSGTLELKISPHKLILDFVFYYRSVLLLSENQVGRYAKHPGKNGTE